MIYLITGQPGSGKTLWMLAHVRAMSEVDGRAVYYNGIADLRLPWMELQDGADWVSVPDGSVVVIDEAQRAFRPRAATSKVPLHVEALETHRHRGIDIFLVTQHPTLIDPNVRRLVEKHFHIKRRFGFKWASVYEFFETREHPDRSRHGGVQSEWRFPVHVFDWYKSASVHTGKVNVPRRIVFLILAPFIVVALLWYLANRFTGKVEEGRRKGKDEKSLVATSGVTDGKGGVVTSAAYRKAFLEEREPAVSGLQFTAPYYRELLKPRSLPSPSACVLMAARCRCYTSQATVLSDVPDSMCRDIVAVGYFEPWRDSAPVAAGRERERPPPPAAPAVSDMPVGVPVPPPGGAASAAVEVVRAPPLVVMPPSEVGAPVSPATPAPTSTPPPASGRFSR